jgi:hypothetical protein
VYISVRDCTGKRLEDNEQNIRREFGNKKKREFFVKILLRLISDFLLRMICVERKYSLSHTFNIYNLNLNIKYLA